MIRDSLAKINSFLDDQMREVLRKAAISLTLRVGGAAAQFAFTVLIARMFGPTGLGRYALALSIVAIASTFARWGVDQATLKYVAIYAARGEKEAVSRLVNQGLHFIGVTGVVVSSVLWLLAPWLARGIFHDMELIVLLRIMIFSILPFSLLNLLAEAIRGLQRIGVHTLVQGVLVPLFSIVFLLLYQFIAGKGLRGAGIAYVSACILVTGTAFFLWQIYLKRQRNDSINNGPVSRRILLTTASPLAWVTLISVAMSFTETLVLGVFRTSAEVGLYAAALRLALLVNFVIIAFNSILAPKFASLYHESNLSAVSALSSKSILAMSVVASPLLGIFIIFPRQVLALFGTEFVSAAAALVVLSFGQLFSILVGPVGIYLMMTGLEKTMRSNLLLSYMANLIAALLLIPSLGVMGGALSATIGIFFLNFSCWVAARRSMTLSKG
jgi:O-antigen/teichoic acid export membrane protein